MFNIISIFGANVVIHVKNGITMFYIGHIIGSIIYLLLNKFLKQRAFIPEIYLSIFLVSLIIIYLNGINIYSSLLLGISNSIFFTLPYYCNLTYKNTSSRVVYIIYNALGILQVIGMDYLLNITHNNIDYLIKIYFAISILILAILLIILNEINSRINKMIKYERKESLFLCLSNSEREVAELLLKNYSNSEIASTIYLSQNTIKFHAKNIYKKLNISNKKELIDLFN